MKKLPLPSQSTIQWLGFAAGPVLGVLAHLLLPEVYEDSRGQMVPFSAAGRATVATAVWMAVWWMTEAIPVYATALLPLAVLPAAGAVTMKAAAAPYGHELIYLFMGGFILALAMQRWGVHRRLALRALLLVGTRPQHVVGAFMLITALLSMWVSNTATTIMMLPIALSVIEWSRREKTRQAVESTAVLSARGDRNFGVCLFLGIAYAASIGGIGTLVGTPPNLFLASFVRDQLGVEISFVRWMAVGLPLVAVFLPIVWLLLTRLLYPIRTGLIEGGRGRVREAYGSLGRVKRGEWATAIVFLLTATMWIFRPLLVRLDCGGVRPFACLSDTGIAMIAALALFVIPVDARNRVFLMDWRTAAKLPWGLLVLFGGGLSLAAAIKTNEVGTFLGCQVVGLAGLPTILLVLVVTAMVIFLTELTSNTATTATLVPILFAIAPALGAQPFVLIVPAAVAASCAFMLPVATPPNAIVFGSGHVKIAEMCKAGFWANLIGIVLITVVVYAVAIPLLGAHLGSAEMLIH